MTDIFQYSHVIKYHVLATCTEALHIGSATGDRAEVLLHPVDNMPFIQASSISGVFRSYFQKMYGKEMTNSLFGSSNQEEDFSGSKIRFSDGCFLTDKIGIRMELRPRVKIDAKMGTAIPGGKFNIECVGAGAMVMFDVYIYGDEYEKNIEAIFAAVNSHEIQFGGQRSNGFGFLHIDKLLYKKFNMLKEDERRLWFQEDDLEEKSYEDKTFTIQHSQYNLNAYEITITGQTEGELLVRSITVSDYGKDAPDSMNIKNAKDEYIIPGSSLKGTVRNQMQMIADYIGQPEIIENTFGVPDEKETKGKLGNICFFDTIVGVKEENDIMPISHRIHIDKFTGGVMQKGLFSEKNISGKLKMQINIQNKNNPDKTCGLLIMALRDMAAGVMNIGSGYSIGKGIIKVDSILIKKNGSDMKEALITFGKNYSIQDSDNIIKNCIQVIRGR